MKWILLITTLLYWPMISSEEIQKKYEGELDNTGNRVCSPHFRNYETFANQRLKLKRAFEQSKGNSEEDLLYKTELAKASEAVKVAEEKARISIYMCLKKLK